MARESNDDSDEKEGPSQLVRPLTRRQVIKAGGIAALGLAFSKPVVETIRPTPVWAQVSPGPGGGGGNTMTFNAVFTATQFATVDESQPNTVITSLSGNIAAALSTDPITLVRSRVRGLLQFDVSTIQAGAQIDRADLTLFTLDNVNEANNLNDIAIDRVTQQWTGLLGPPGNPFPPPAGVVTWNTQPVVASTLIVPVSVNVVFTTYTWDISSVVQGWVNGAFTNHGLMVKHGSDDPSNPNSPNDPNNPNPPANLGDFFKAFLVNGGGVLPFEARLDVDWTVGVNGED